MSTELAKRITLDQAIGKTLLRFDLESGEYDVILVFENQEYVAFNSMEGGGIEQPEQTQQLTTQ